MSDFEPTARGRATPSDRSRLISPDGAPISQVPPSADSFEGVEQYSSITRPLQVPRWLDQMAAWSWRLILIVVAFVGLLWILDKIRLAVIPALVAIIVASAVRPIVRDLRESGVPKVVAAILPVITTLVIVVGGLVAIGVVTQRELADAEFQTEEIRQEVRQWFMDEPFDLSLDEVDQAEAQLRTTLIGGARNFGATGSHLLLPMATGFLLVIVLTLMLSLDGGKLWRATVRNVHPVRRQAMDQAGRAAADSLASYVRSVAIIGMVDAALFGVGLWILGIPLAVPLAVLTFLAAFFPVVGAAASGLIAAIVAVVTVDPVSGLWVVLLAIAVQQIDGNIVMPMIAGHRLHLHPSVILVSLTAGGAIAGLAGAFLAVPLVGAATAAARAFRAASVAEQLVEDAATPVGNVLRSDGQTSG